MRAAGQIHSTPQTQREPQVQTFMNAPFATPPTLAMYQRSSTPISSHPATPHHKRFLPMIHGETNELATRTTINNKVVQDLNSEFRRTTLGKKQIDLTIILHFHVSAPRLN